MLTNLAVLYILEQSVRRPQPSFDISEQPTICSNADACDTFVLQCADNIGCHAGAQILWRQDDTTPGDPEVWRCLCMHHLVLIN